MNSITIDADLSRHTISRHICGHFAEHLGRCIYGKFWTGEDSDVPNTRGIRDVGEIVGNVSGRSGATRILFRIDS